MKKNIHNCLLFAVAGSMLLFYSCSNYVKIIAANKTMHISGLSNGKNYLDYTVKIDSKVNFNFQSLSLNDTKVLENQYVKDLSTGLSSTKINPNIPKGIYLFGFRIYSTDSFNTEETVTFNYLIDDTAFQLKKLVHKEDKIQTNR